MPPSFKSFLLWDVVSVEFICPLWKALEKPWMFFLTITATFCRRFHHNPWWFPASPMVICPGLMGLCLSFCWSGSRHLTPWHPRFFGRLQSHLLVGGWTNPFEKYYSKWESSPNKGENKKYLSCHHLVYVAFWGEHLRGLSWSNTASLLILQKYTLNFIHHA